jgi:hypothetical protein
MTTSTCSIDNCLRPRKSRGWCSTHYQRWIRTGSVTTVRGNPITAQPIRERILNRTSQNPETGCWDWRGHLSSSGYGTIRYRDRDQYVHRLMYELTHGAIPAGLHIDHLCRNPPCCNPRHLEPVTVRENARRGAKCLNFGVCLNGHVVAEVGTYESPRGKRGCRGCLRSAQERRKAKDALLAAERQLKRRSRQAA